MAHMFVSLALLCDCDVKRCITDHSTFKTTFLFYNVLIKTL